MFSTTTLWIIIAVLAFIIGVLVALIYRASSALTDAVMKVLWKR